MSNESKTDNQVSEGDQSRVVESKISDTSSNQEKTNEELLLNEMASIKHNLGELARLLFIYIAKDNPSDVVDDGDSLTLKPNPIQKRFIRARPFYVEQDLTEEEIEIKPSNSIEDNLFYVG